MNLMTGRRGFVPVAVALASAALFGCSGCSASATPSGGADSGGIVEPAGPDATLIKDDDARWQDRSPGEVRSLCEEFQTGSDRQPAGSEDPPGAGRGTAGEPTSARTAWLARMGERCN